MISSARFLGLAASCITFLLAGAMAGPAGAQDACKTDLITAAGKGKFRPFTKTKELEGRGSAMADAVANWEREVGTKFGDPWKKWDKAKDTKFDCAPTKTGKIIGTSFIGCTISGRPCSAGMPPPGRASVTDIEEKGSGKRKRSVTRERLDPRASAYEREMGYQRRLAEERNREETRAYEREMAYQERLAKERDRAEGRTTARENARARYYSDELRRRERD